MSGISGTFLESVAAEVNVREQKMKDVADGLESFFTKLVQTEFPEIDNDNEVTFSLDKDDTFHDDDYYFTQIHASVAKYSGSLEIRLGMGINTSGRAYVHFWGDEFKESDEEGKENNEGSSFDSDSYTAAQTVAKMLTLIQHHDLDIFGPRIPYVLKDIQAQAPKPQEPPLFFRPRPKP